MKVPSLFALWCVITSCDSSVRNVLLVMVDDLRTETGSYGSNQVRTPHLNNFAQESIQFENAYAALPKCGPSRFSMLTGKEPSSSGYYYHLNANLENRLVKSSMNLVSWFRKKGYRTYGFGKLFHFPKSSKTVFNRFVHSQHHLPSKCTNSFSLICPSETERLTDLGAVQNVNKTLDLVANNKKPWLLALGIRRPHLKWEYPQRLEAGAPKVSLPKYPSKSKSTPDIASRQICKEISISPELAKSQYTTSGLIEPSIASKLRSAYFRSVEWADELIGMVLGKLKEKELEENTLVVIVSDHGFNLGENGDWCKMSLQRQVLRVPFWIKDPRTPSLAGQRVSVPIQLVDLFPTIADLAGIPVDLRTKEKYAIDGISFQQNVNPSIPMSSYTAEIARSQPPRRVGTQLDGHKLAFSVLQRCEVPGCEGVQQDGFAAMGYCIQTEQYRYVEWRRWLPEVQEGDWDSSPVAVELYNTKTDSNEVSNLAADNVNLRYLVSTSDKKKRKDSTIQLELSYELRAHFVHCERFSNGKTVSSSICDSRGLHCAVIRGRCSLATFAH